MSQSKARMMAPRHSIEYKEGVKSFFAFIEANKEKLGGDDWYCCPCVKCRNLKGGKKTLGDIYDHLICHGIDTSYTTWIHHGEIHPKSCLNVEGGGMERLSDTFPRMIDMVNDVFEHFQDEIESQAHMGGNTSPCSHEAPNEEFVESQDYSMDDIRYKKLMEDATKPLYPSCQIGHKSCL